MLRNKTIKALALAMTVALTGIIFAGCGKSGLGNKADQVIKYNLTASDLKTIDPGLNSSVEGGTVIGNAFEGLLNLDDKEQPVAGVAEKWEISPDGLNYTFHLRKDAKWSDGKPVKAGDFEYAWKRALAPETASEYAYQLYYLKNGEAYNTSNDPKAAKKATADEVGVKAVDDNTLKVTLESSTPYFLSLLSFETYAPVRKDIVEKNPKGWATKVETYVSNGPFMMKEWKTKDTLTFVKNPNYWDAKSIKLDKIEYKFLDNSSSYLSAFKTGQIDIIEAPPSQEVPNLIKDGTAKIYPDLGLDYYSFNVSPDAVKINPASAKVMSDVRVRKAISLAIDRKAIVEKVTKGGELPATSFVPRGMPEDKSGKDFKSKDYYKPEGEPDEAKKLLAEAGFPDGKGFPEIELLYNTKELNQSVAQAVQDMLRKNLNINIKLRNVERKVQLDVTTKHQYEMARNGWGADYIDPMTFLDIFTSTSGNNVSGYNNPEYDKLIATAKAETDAAKRMADMHAAEDMIMRDMPVVPIFYRTKVACIKPSIKGVHFSPLGYVFFRNAYVEK